MCRLELGKDIEDGVVLGTTLDGDVKISSVHLVGVDCHTVNAVRRRPYGKLRVPIVGDLVLVHTHRQRIRQNMALVFAVQNFHEKIIMRMIVIG